MEHEAGYPAREPRPALLPAAPEVQRRLQQRARRLARSLTPEPDRHARQELFVFRVGQATYGVSLTAVKEVLRAVNVTPIPCTPPFVCGVINRRGRIFSVIDLPLFWGAAPAPPDVEAPVEVVLVHHGEMEVGLRADAIEGTLGLATREVQPPPPTMDPATARCLKGVTERLYVLDMPALLTHEKLVVRDEPVQ